tara:strand:- start:2583 stop:4355 length:1773 start_codon:yes stop_codon:yes gene_type:complete
MKLKQEKHVPPMRAQYSNNYEHSSQISFEFEGQILNAYPGDSVAAALTSYGIMDLRETSSGESRGIFCGMGVCHECLVDIDGEQNKRACMTKLKNGMKINRQKFYSVPNVNFSNKKKKNNSGLKVEKPDILVIGGGVGGMSAAAVAAETGAKVILIDERSLLGGQFSKQPTPFNDNTIFSKNDSQINLGKKLIKRMEHAKVEIFKNVEIWGAYPDKNVLAIKDGENLLFEPKNLIVATGAYERPLPIKGWTLPGVMTTGAAQTLLRTYNVVAGKKIFIAGNGPFNIQVALELERAGSSIVGISESAYKPKLSSIGSIFDMFLGSPKLFFKGISYLNELKKKKIKIKYNHVLSSIKKIGNSLDCEITPNLSSKSMNSEKISFNCDILCMGYGFLPSNTLLRNLGCEFKYDLFRKQLVLVRSEKFETNKQGLYAVGDCAGLGGAYAACEEGIIAGINSSSSLGFKINGKQEKEYKKSFKILKRQRKFQSGFWNLYKSDLPSIMDLKDETYICRCELVKNTHIRKALDSGCQSISEIKQKTRAGMGRCQGRYCSQFIAEIVSSVTNEPIGEKSFFAPRFPLSPVTIGEILSTK